MTIRELMRGSQSEVISNLLNELRGKAVLDQSELDDVGIKTIRRAVKKVIEKTPFDEQLDAVKEINELFDGVTRAPDNSIIESRICRTDKLFDATETRVRLLRYLQGGETPSDDFNRSRDDIAEDFGISTNALNEHLTALQDKCDLLGSEVQITLRRGQNNYDSTVHPFFLALNLSEIYLLMIAIRQKLENDPFKEAYQNIMADLYRQLSPYARQKVDYFAQRDGMDLFNGRDYTTFKKGYREEIKENIISFLKRGDRCCIQFTDEIPHKRVGIIKVGHGADGYVFEDDTGECIQFGANGAEITSITQAETQIPT